MELTTSAFEDLGSPEYRDSVATKLDKQNKLFKHKKIETSSTPSESAFEAGFDEHNYQQDPFQQDSPKEGFIAKAKNKIKNTDVRGAFTKAAAVTLIAGALGGAGYGTVEAVGSYYTEKTVTATVTEKGITTSSSTDSKGNTTVTSNYMIYTDKGTFINHDSLVKGKFNSSDVYGQLQKGQAYQFNVHGWRNHFLSMYPNIDKVTPAAPSSSPASVPGLK